MPEDYSPMPGFDPNEQISQHFTLGDLTKTSQGTNNTPDFQSYLNLKRLAGILETLWLGIGPFDLASAYRSPETNEAVGGSETSAHMRGDAADIIPTTMSIEDYFVQIYGNETYRNMLGEITFKETQGALHITAPLTSPPYRTAKRGYAEVRDAYDNYRGMTDEEWQTLVSGSAPDSLELTSDETSTPMSVFAKAGVGIAVLVLASAVAYFIYNRKLRK